MLVLVVCPRAVPASEGGGKCERDVPGTETERERFGEGGAHRSLVGLKL